MKNYIFVYARVSTKQQNLDSQLDAFRKYGYDVIYNEKMTWIKYDWADLSKLIGRMTESNPVVIKSRSRLSRSTKDMIALTELFAIKLYHTQ